MSAGNLSSVTCTVTAAGRTVRALWAHGDVLFIVRDAAVFTAISQTIQVEIYDINDFEPKRCLTLPTGISEAVWGSMVSMTSYPADSHVLVGTGKMIFRVESTRNNRVDTWCTVGDTLMALASGSDSVLAMVSSQQLGCMTNYSTVIIKRFSKRGLPVGESALKVGLAGIWRHVLLMPDGAFIVSHSDATSANHFVTSINADGKVVKTYGGKRGMAMGHLNKPGQVAYNKKTGQVIIADTGNDRVEIVNATSGVILDLPVPDEVDMREPFALCFDEVRNRLYVGESIDYEVGFISGKQITTSARLLVFDDVFSSK